MRYKVVLTSGALSDLAEILDYVDSQDSSAAADSLAGHLDKIMLSLESFPQRGSIVKELRELGIREYRETFFKPYRFIYKVSRNFVYINVIADGRRDMESLVRQRVLEQ